jgi:hypothetical protein
MKYRLNFIASLFILIALAFSCSFFKAKKDTDKNKTQTTAPESKDQYRIAENYQDDKSQIIDLIEGPAAFDMKYDGSSNFIVHLLNPDGTLVEVLADTNGSYKGYKTINVPKTGSYILDVKCKGTWSIYRK